MVLAKLFQVSEVVKASHTAGVSDGDFPPAAQYFCQLFFNAGGFSLYIHGMDQKLRAASGEFVQNRRGQTHVRKFLPAVSDDIVGVVFFPAA